MCRLRWLGLACLVLPCLVGCPATPDTMPRTPPAKTVRQTSLTPPAQPDLHARYNREQTAALLACGLLGGAAVSPGHLLLYAGFAEETDDALEMSPSRRRSTHRPHYLHSRRTVYHPLFWRSTTAGPRWPVTVVTTTRSAAPTRSTSTPSSSSKSTVSTPSSSSKTTTARTTTSSKPSSTTKSSSSSSKSSSSRSSSRRR